MAPPHSLRVLRRYQRARQNEPQYCPGRLDAHILWPWRCRNRLGQCSVVEEGENHGSLACLSQQVRRRPSPSMQLEILRRRLNDLRGYLVVFAACSRIISGGKCVLSSKTSQSQNAIPNMKAHMQSTTYHNTIHSFNPATPQVIYIFCPSILACGHTHKPPQSAPYSFGSQLSLGSSWHTCPFSSHAKPAKPPHILSLTQMPSASQAGPQPGV